MASIVAPDTASRCLGSRRDSSSFRHSALRQSRWQAQSSARAVRGVVAEVSMRQNSARPRQPRVVDMVAPAEAKRLAAEEWRLLQSRAKLRRQRKIESINGGWAMIGLTAGVIVEGVTGNGILAQVADHLDTLSNFLSQFATVADSPV